MKIKISRKARKDLLRIGKHTEEKWGITQRNHYLKQIDDAFNLLAENPVLGKDCSYILEGYRKFSQGSHVIYYQVRDVLKIIRILHKNMDVELNLP